MFLICLFSESFKIVCKISFITFIVIKRIIESFMGVKNQHWSILKLYSLYKKKKLPEVLGARFLMNIDGLKVYEPT